MFWRFGFLRTKAAFWFGPLGAAFLFLSFFFAAPVHSLQLTLGWNVNPEPDIAGYKIHYGLSSRNYTSHSDVGNQTSYLVSNLQDGTKYYFAVTAYNSIGQESTYSTEAVYTPPSPSCTYSISPSARTISASGGSGAVDVASNAGCPWTAVSNASWMIITSNSSGSASGTVNYSVSGNLSSASRTGTLTIAGTTFALTQSGAACTYSISPANRTLTSAGGTTGSVSVTAPTGCTWSASSGASWITITSGSNGSGNGTCGYSVTANPGTSSRTGSLTIAGQTFSITQAGISCSFSLSPASQSFTSTAGTGSVNVAAPTGCSWSASTGASWITITSGSNGSGNGTCGYSVAPNSGTSSRTGSLTVAGQTFTINQSGVSCSFSISPASRSLDSAGGTGTINVTAPSGCSWSGSSGTGWITVTSGASGNGNGSCGYSVAANPGTVIPHRLPYDSRANLCYKPVGDILQLFHFSGQPALYFHRRNRVSQCVCTKRLFLERFERSKLDRRHLRNQRQRQWKLRILGRR